MKSCSIRDLLRLALPLGTRLVTCEQGLEHQIHHAVSLRGTLPAFPALRGGEIVLLSVGDALALDERLTLERIVTRLAEVRVAAVAFAGPAAAAAAAAADAIGLPLLHLPDGVNPRSVERDVRYLLDNHDLQVERRAAQLYHVLTRQVVGGAAIETLLQTVQEATGRTVAYYGAANELSCLLGAQPGDDHFRHLRPWEFAEAGLNGHPFVVKRVGQGSSTFGYLVLGGEGLDQWDDSAASQGANALLLELKKQQAVESVAARMGGDLLQSILSGKRVDMAVVQEQAAELGYDLRRPYVAVLLAAAGGTSPESVRDRLQDLLRREQITAPHVLCSHAVFCLFPAGQGLDRVWGLLAALSKDGPIDAGISQPAASAAECQRAYREADQALSFGRRLFGPASVTDFRDLHVYRLLFAFRSSPELWIFCRSTLGALIDYDQAHGAALLDTLDVFFAARGNLTQASERLKIHRNTLLYRLRRIGQISGMDVESPDDMLALQVALRTHRVLSSLGTSNDDPHPMLQNNSRSTAAEERGGEPAGPGQRPPPS